MVLYVPYISTSIALGFCGCRNPSANEERGFDVLSAKAPVLRCRAAPAAVGHRRNARSAPTKGRSLLAPRAWCTETSYPNQDSGSAGTLVLIMVY